MLISYLCLALGMSIVGAYVGFSKTLVAVFPVFLLAWLRFGVAAIAMSGWVKREADYPPLDAASKRLLFFESFFGNFLFSICMLFGMRYAGAVTAGVVMAAIPAVVALMSWVALSERISRRVWIAILLSVAGVALLAFGSNDAANSSNPLLGVLLLLGAVVCEAAYVVIGKKITGKVSAKRISAIINLWGLVLMTPFGVWQASTFDFSRVPIALWCGLVVYALAASMWTVWLWMTGLKKVPAARAGVFTVFLPITSALVGILFLGESFTTQHTAAFSLAIAAVLLATWSSKAEGSG